MKLRTDLFAVQTFHHGGVDFQVIQQPITVWAAARVKITGWNKKKKDSSSSVLLSYQNVRILIGWREYQWNVMHCYKR